MTKLVEVVWRDARFNLDDPIGLVEMRTVGWMLADDDEHVLVAGERATDEEYYRAFTAIPRGCVCEVRAL